MYRILICAALTISITGCASNQTGSQDSAQELEQETASTFVKSKLKENGADAMCSQKMFTECFSRSVQACVADMSTHSISCVEKSEEKIAFIRDTEDLTQFSIVYSTCMVTEYLVGLSADIADNMEEISSCMTAHEVDQDALNKALLK